MTEVIAITAESRARAGKGTARQTRREGRIPAVIYGANKTPNLISLDNSTFTRQIHRPGFFTHLFDITVDGKAERCLPRDVQFDPVTDRPLHVDFLRVSANSTITVEIPVEFVNSEKSPGLKAGGVLNIVRHTIEMECRANDIPEKIVVDLTGANVGDSIHISAVKLPAGAKPVVAERDFTVATVVAPSSLKSEEAAATTEAAAS